MLNILKTRWKLGKRTIAFPVAKSALPDRFRGEPAIKAAACDEACSACVSACPTDAVMKPENSSGSGIRIDLGKCLFCGACAEVCPRDALEFSREYRLAANERNRLIRDGRPPTRADALRKEMLSVFRRSLKLRQVSAGGCNGCEVDINVLWTSVFDLVRFGIQLVASPRHADGLIVTGPVTDNMRQALLATYEAMPAPKIVIAVGACAISGGPFRDHPEVHNGLTGLLPVDLYIPGCPPHPATTMDGLLRLIGKLR